MNRFLRPGRFGRCIWQATLCLALLASGQSHAAAPALEYFFPIAFARGARETVTFGGKLEPWPVAVWTDCAGVSFSATTNSGKIFVQVNPDAPIGPHLLRVYNSEGASAPRIFVVSALADTGEKEPNDSLKQAQALEKLPVTINGRLEKTGDVDFYALNLEAGKWFVAKVDAFSLGSPVDAALHLLDARGVRIAFCHDDGPRLDPVLAYKIDKSGAYFLELAGFVNPPAADIRYAGSPATIYRLALTQGPFIKHLFPPGMRQGEKTSMQALGWNLAASNAPLCNNAFAGAESEMTFVSVETPENRIPIALSDANEVMEIEPNNFLTNAQSISWPCVVNGRIAPAGDDDRFQFSAQKGDHFVLQIDSAALGFSLDSLLRIEDSVGRQLAPGDRGGAESKLDWTAPTNGNYIVAVSDLFHRGGDDYGYRLAIGPPEPSFRAIVAQDSIRVIAGETNELKIDITRLNNYTNALAISVEGLPEGVSAKAPEIPAKNGEVKLPFIASAGAIPANQPFRILVQSITAAGTKTRVAMFDLGDRLINHTDQIWLTVVPKPPPAAAKAPEKK